MEPLALTLLGGLAFALVHSQTVDSHRSVAITFDDLPDGTARDVPTIKRNTMKLLRVLNHHRAPAIGFVNEINVCVPGETDARVGLLRQWLDSGMTLGNHGFSHLRFFDTPLAKYQDDVIKGEVITRPLMSERGSHHLYFRHPYTSTGATREVKAAFEKFLAGRGYKIAPFTIGNSDFIFNDLYVDARGNKDAEMMRRVREGYLQYTDSQFEFFERRSAEMFGRQISQTFLIHANDINADCLDEMLSRLAVRGYRFVTLDGALEDEAYRTRDDYVGPAGPSWLHRWTLSLGMTWERDQEPGLPEWVVKAFKSLQSRTNAAWPGEPRPVSQAS